MPDDGFLAPCTELLVYFRSDDADSGEEEGSFTKASIKKKGSEKKLIRRETTLANGLRFADDDDDDYRNHDFRKGGGKGEERLVIELSDESEFEIENELGEDGEEECSQDCEEDDEEEEEEEQEDVLEDVGEVFFEDKCEPGTVELIRNRVKSNRAPAQRKKNDCTEGVAKRLSKKPHIMEGGKRNIRTVEKEGELCAEEGIDEIKKAGQRCNRKTEAVALLVSSGEDTDEYCDADVAGSANGSDAEENEIHREMAVLGMGPKRGKRRKPATETIWPEVKTSRKRPKLSQANSDDEDGGSGRINAEEADFAESLKSREDNRRGNELQDMEECSDSQENGQKVGLKKERRKAKIENCNSNNEGETQKETTKNIVQSTATIPAVENVPECVVLVSPPLPEYVRMLAQNHGNEEGGKKSISSKYTSHPRRRLKGSKSLSLSKGNKSLCGPIVENGSSMCSESTCEEYSSSNCLSTIERDSFCTSSDVVSGSSAERASASPVEVPSGDILAGIYCWWFTHVCLPKDVSPDNLGFL